MCRQWTTAISLASLFLHVGLYCLCRAYRAWQRAIQNRVIYFRCEWGFVVSVTREMSAKEWTTIVQKIDTVAGDDVNKTKYVHWRRALFCDSCSQLQHQRRQSVNTPCLPYIFTLRRLTVSDRDISLVEEKDKQKIRYFRLQREFLTVFWYVFLYCIFLYRVLCNRSTPWLLLLSASYGFNRLLLYYVYFVLLIRSVLPIDKCSGGKQPRLIAIGPVYCAMKLSGLSVADAELIASYTHFNCARFIHWNLIYAVFVSLNQ